MNICLNTKIILKDIYMVTNIEITKYTKRT